MSVQTLPNVKKVRMNRTVSKVREGEKEIRSKVQEAEKRNMSKTQEGEKDSKTNLHDGQLRNRSMKQMGKGGERLNNGRPSQKLDFEAMFCHHCDDILAGHRYVLKEEHPYCIKCYENVFANPCNDCTRVIGIDSKDLSYKEKHWHEACFICNKCRTSLVDKQFGSKADRIYCGPCHDELFGSPCAGCGEVFRAGMKKMEYKSRQWHESCFICCTCKSVIGAKSFIPSGNDIYCDGCYEEAYAAKCSRCSKVVTTGGVTYRDQPWHRECFTCSHCQQSLAGLSFTSRQDQPYCADCAALLFSKKCSACAKPITGMGGTRFISFEGRHWHNACFSCSSCPTSLVGKGFISDKEDVICPECAKNRMEADTIET
eukprot:GFUD01035698.1.p1 GENE.GFUD01035698.1~~GFUD01035698.1.p1  ORF type:complete len:398 (+),score=121.48 GFUD01035698.1:82-1194(+)